MTKTIQILTRYPEQLVTALDNLVDEGLYSSRTDALRDAARVLVRMQRGIISTEKTGIELQKEGNKKLKKLYSSKAKGNKKKISEHIVKDLKKIKV